MNFTFEARVPVRRPYRLDFTVDALRRLSANVVNVVAEDDTYRRAVRDAQGTNLIEVRQPAAAYLQVRIAGPGASRRLALVERMLGVHVTLDGWERRAQAFPWLAALAERFRGLHPPRYPTLWEALAHAIVFQQISIHAAAAIMRRTIEALSQPLEHGEITQYPFPSPRELLKADGEHLRAAGLSANKIAHLRTAAAAVLDAVVVEDAIALLPSPQAAQCLTAVPGIGVWSAAVVLLRGLGRLDVFPMKDSGVARSLSLLSGDPAIDPSALLEALGPMRGMLYFHLLLGRVHRQPP